PRVTRRRSRGPETLRRGWITVASTPRARVETTSTGSFAIHQRGATMQRINVGGLRHGAADGCRVAGVLGGMGLFLVLSLTASPGAAFASSPADGTAANY